MPRGRTSKYTAKQERKAEKIKEGYLERGVSRKVASRIAWATVNKLDRGGRNPGGSGRGKPRRSPTGKKRLSATRSR
jgi:plasmid stabilization system protein ParE